MLLELIAGLSDRDNRFEAAKKLADHFGCRYLFIFVIDQEIGVLLPAQGFPQTLPDGLAWHSFINNCPRDGSCSGSLPFPDKRMLLPATGFSGADDSIFILLGGNPSANELVPLKEISPILISLFAQEAIYSAVKTKVAFAEKTAAKAENLARTIDVMRLHLNDALNQKEKDKKAIEDMMDKKDVFINMASHELKTPVTTLKAYLQMLQKMALPTPLSRAGDFIDKANKQIKKITDLIDDLLNVNKIQAGKMIYQFSDIDLGTLIEEVVEQAQMTTSTHRIVLQNAQSIIIRGERNRLEQVLSNFLSNAIKYSPDASEVVVNCEITGSEVRVSVRDFGIGIPPDEREYVFDRFYRVHESSIKFSGLGLGLFISAEIIKNHGGAIGVESDRSGSEFYFAIPLVKVQDNF